MVANLGITFLAAAGSILIVLLVVGGTAVGGVMNLVWIVAVISGFTTIVVMEKRTFRREWVFSPTSEVAG